MEELKLFLEGKRDSSSSSSIFRKRGSEDSWWDRQTGSKEGKSSFFPCRKLARIGWHAFFIACQTKKRRNLPHFFLGEKKKLFSLYFLIRFIWMMSFLSDLRMYGRWPVCILYPTLLDISRWRISCRIETLLPPFLTGQGNFFLPEDQEEESGGDRQ